MCQVIDLDMSAVLPLLSPSKKEVEQMYETLKRMEIAACRAELAAAKAERDRREAQKLLEQARAETARAAAYRQSCGRLVRNVHHADVAFALRDGNLEVTYE